jgi:hypothetical protein
MAGMIEQQIAKAPQDEPAAQPANEPANQSATPAGGNPKGAPQYKSKAVEAVPQNLRATFERVVLAGMKIFYSPKMKQMIQQEIAKPGPVEKKLAEGVAGLMALIDSQAKKGLPREILIPAGIELLYEVAEFLSETGQIKVTPEQLQQAATYLAVIIAKRYGASDQQIQQMLQAQGGQAAAQPAEPAAPAEPADEEIPPADEEEEEEEQV